MARTSNFGLSRRVGAGLALGRVLLVERSQSLAGISSFYAQYWSAHAATTLGIGFSGVQGT